MSRFVLLCLLMGQACSRCVDAPAVRDAGTVTRRNVDLRVALLYAYPEYRDTSLLEARASVWRDIPGLTSKHRDASLAALKYVPADGGQSWDLHQFHLEQLSPQRLEVSLALSPESLGHLYLAPAGLSSTEMGLYLPRDLPVGQEGFVLDLRYQTTPARAAQLVRQAVSLLLNNQQWKLTTAPPDWADGGATEEREITVVVTGIDGARISWSRTAGEVKARYEFDTVL